MSTTSSRRRGIVTHDYRITASSIDATETSADQAGPYPGPAVDQGSSAMTIRTSGVMAADQSYTITAERGGFPGSTERSAGFSYNDGTHTYYWDPPGVLSGFEFVNFVTSGAGTSDGYREHEPSLCVLDSGVVLMATRGTNIATSEVAIRIRSYDPDTNTWDLLDTITDLTTIDDSQRIGPCLVVTPDGDVHLYYYVASTTQIAHWVSDDNGATWSRASPGCLTSVPQDYLPAAPLSIYGVSMRGAYSAGNVVLMLGFEAPATFTSFVILCSSSDGGYTMQPDLEYSGAYSATYEDWRDVGITPVPGGGFRMSIAGRSVPEVHAADEITFLHRAFSGGYSDFRALNGSGIWSVFGQENPIPDSATAVQAVEGGTLASEYTACTWATEDGVYQAAISSGDQDDATPVDRGALTVHRMDGAGVVQQISATAIDHGSLAATTYLRRISAVETRGMTILAGQMATTTGAIGAGSIAVAYLGGHTSVGIPPASLTDINSMARNSWGWQFHAIDNPDDGGAFKSGANTGTITQEAEGLHISCTSTQTYWFEPNSGEEPSDEDSELVFEFELYDVNNNLATGANQPRTGAEIIYRHNAGAKQYRAFVNTSDSVVLVYDAVSATTVGSTAVDLTGRVEIRVAIYRSRINAWARNVTSRAERGWTHFIANGTLGGTAITAATHVVKWGMISTSTSGTQSMTVSRAQIMQVPAALASTGMASLDMLPRPLASKPITIPGGLRLEAVGGPAVIGDSWVVETKYYYGFENLFTDNPAQVWRSTQDNTTMRIAFDLTGFSSAAGMLEAFAFGAALLNSNLKDWRIQIQTNTAKGTNVDWMLVYAQPFAVHEAPAGEEVGSFAVGNVVYPDGGGEPLRWIEHNELSGCQIFDVGADRSFRIIGNSSGEWAGEYTHREAYAYLHPDDSPELYNGGSGAYIHLRNSAGFVWDAPPAGTRWLVLTIPGQRTYEGCYEIGRFIAGPLRVFGREYSEDRSLEQRSNVELTTRRDGSRYAHSRGPQRRSVTISWREGVDETALYSALEPKEVPFVSGFTPAEAVANPADTVKLVRGLFHEADGATEPILYLPSIPTHIQSGSLTARDALLYGRIVSQIEIGQILGNEEENQVHRLGAIRIEEEIG